jgi:hypothetical protein
MCGYKRLLPVMDQQQIFKLDRTRLRKKHKLFYTH